MGEAVVRYDQDFIGWTEQQARVLQEAAAHGSNLALDWKNLIEEVEGLGRSQYDAVASHVRRVMVHLLKLEFSPAGGPKASWRESVRDARADIEGRLQRDPGLKPRLAEMIGSKAPRTTKLAASGKDLELQGEGRIGMRELATDSLADVAVKFKVNDGYRTKSDMTKTLFGAPGSNAAPLFDLDPKVKQSKRPDGFYAWTIRGPLGRPEFIPAGGGGAPGGAPMMPGLTMPGGGAGPVLKLPN